MKKQSGTGDSNAMKSLSEVALGKGQQVTRFKRETAVIRNVKLLVFYDSREFKVNCLPKIEQKGEYQGADGFPHIKCQIQLSPPLDGMVKFDDIQKALTPFFTPPRIQTIRQYRGVVQERREVAWVTFLPTDKLPREGDERFCDCKGEEFLWAEIKEEDDRLIVSGDKVLICGGGRRTIVKIFKS